MKITLMAIMMFLIQGAAYSQNEESNSYFAQCLFDIQNPTELLEIENEIRENPSISIVRLDFDAQRALIRTKQIEEFTEADVRAFFEGHGYQISCVQVGIDGVDQMQPFPFQNCEN